MERIAPYLGALVAVVLVVTALSFSRQTTVSSSLVANTTASSSVEVLPGFSLPSVRLPDALASTSSSTAAHITPKNETTPSGTTPSVSSAPHETTPTPVPTPAKQVSAASSSASTTNQSPQTASSGNAALDASAAALRVALVNILCYTPAGSQLHSISGSGVIISPTGLILTNAHVAQYFLLSDQGVSCTVRTGSPARDAYTADLAFISPAWVHANAVVITEATPSGTGEHDYALLAISGSATDTPAPASYPFVPISAYPPAVGAPVVIGSYGAQFLESNQIQSSLFPTIVFGSVKDRYTFGTNTEDVISLGGSAAAQEGSSGGGVVGTEGALVGTITTSTVTGSTATRSLDAITTSYIRAAYASETGKPLESLLTESTTTAVENFKSDASALESVILGTIGQ